jgi:hypothetical protein
MSRPDTYEDAVAATRDLIHELLRSGLMLVDTLSSLIDELPDDAYPDEDAGDVVVDMVVGSCVPVARATGVHETRIATALIGAIRDRVVGQLEEAARLASKGEA